MIRYADLIQGDAAAAIEAMKRYATLNTNEPNPQDSLGEALMAGGQFAEADAAFQKAAGLDPKFFGAWEGVAYTKFFAGDWTAGKQALANAASVAALVLSTQSAIVEKPEEVEHDHDGHSHSHGGGHGHSHSHGPGF